MRRSAAQTGRNIFRKRGSAAFCSKIFHPFLSVQSMPLGSCAAAALLIALTDEGKEGEGNTL